MNTETKHLIEDAEPRWPALLALLAVGGLYEALPPSMQFGPPYILIGLVILLMIPTTLTRHRGRHDISRVLSLLVVSLVTVFMIISLFRLVHTLLMGQVQPGRLLLSSAALWINNVLVFSIWYWQLDSGGPHQRDLHGKCVIGAFLFPQMIMTPEAKQAANMTDWSQSFIDYLFLSFNTSTALSPTDTAVLSRWAKMMMMAQALISLTVIALLAARAVNIISQS